MISLFLHWFVQTSLMPLCVGAATGLLAPWAWGPGCAQPALRRAVFAAGAAWGVHLLFVGSALVREGAMLDYGAVLLASVVASAVGCASGSPTESDR